MTGDTQYNLGDYDSAAAAYRRGLKRDRSSSTLESKLGLAEARAGNARAGRRRIRHAIEKEPANPELYDRLILVDVWLNNLPQAVETAERKLKEVQARPEDYSRAASIWAQMRQWSRTADILRAGLALFPDSEPLRENLTRVETFLRSEAAEPVQSENH
jgi:tetratricopeptide (TPR) repeat protein